MNSMKIYITTPDCAAAQEFEITAKKVDTGGTVAQHLAYCIEQATLKLPNGEKARIAFNNAMDECDETAAWLKTKPAPGAELFSKCEDAPQLASYLANHYSFLSRATMEAIATRYSAGANRTLSNAADSKIDIRVAVGTTGTITTLPDSKHQLALPEYGPTIRYSDVKSALDLYDLKKGRWKKIGFADDEKNIQKLRKFYTDLKPEGANLNSVLNYNQLFQLAKIVSKIRYYYSDDQKASAECVISIRQLFGTERSYFFYTCSYKIERLELNEFITYFHVPDQFVKIIDALLTYIKEFSFILDALKQKPSLAENILNVLKWLENRKILTEKNAKTIILLHIDAIHLFIETAPAEDINIGGSCYVTGWFFKNTPVQDTRFQQMLFDTIIKRATERKVVALFCGLKPKEKESSIGKVFGSSEIADLKALKEISNFLKPSPG